MRPEGMAAASRFQAIDARRLERLEVRGPARISRPGRQPRLHPVDGGVEEGIGVLERQGRVVTSGGLEVRGRHGPAMLAPRARQDQAGEEC